jgi:diguanylate cyclase (GGDEF)-like protein
MTGEPRVEECTGFADDESMDGQTAPSGLRGLWPAIRRILPRGGMLPADEWQRRHKALLVFLWANVVGFTVYGLVSQEYGFGHTLLHGGSLLGFAILGSLPRLGRTARTLCVSLGLITAAALLVHVTNGLIEAHFYFFVMVAALTIYEDWRSFLVAVAYVLVHHGVMGMIDPHSVFNRPEEFAHPWLWAGIHATFVAGAGAAALIAWRLNENVREGMLAAQALLEDAAMVDSLTDLPNRRRLMADLSALDDPAILALFDLDGFKTYNDTFGHAAGDALLTRLGHTLQAAAIAPAKAYRLGGDEFCLLAPLGEVDVETLLAGAQDALADHGQGFSISASFGTAVLPEETASTEEALQLADRRMYAQKMGGRPSAGRQVGDALMRALEERHPDLGEHVDDVARLCEAVATSLGMSEHDVQCVRQAAELHDVGKVAIPDAILLKPGPLDPDERAFIDRHTVIGERIVAAAPALARVASLVRSSHERVDGTGYPDNLTGDDIPLGARIIGVCDAFDAMVTPRPYRIDPKTEREALAELRRCAGSQFDAQVVEAFVAVLAERRAAPKLAI